MIMRRNTSSDSHQPLKSYRERRAQSKTNHNQFTSTDTKGLQEIQDTLKKRRMSIQEGQTSLFGSFIEQQTIKEEQTMKIKTEVYEQDQKLQETQMTSRIIQKYGDALQFIKEVEEEQILNIKINPESQYKSTKANIVPPIKNFPVSQTKKAITSARSSFNLSKIPSKTNSTDLNNFITPRKTTTKQPISKNPMISSIKSDRKVADVKNDKKVSETRLKLQQNKFLKKLQGLQQELSKLGFQKSSQAKWHLKNILELLKQ